MNWARRTDCNVCNNPKFGTVEPRTGTEFSTEVLSVLRLNAGIDLLDAHFVG